MVKPLTPEFKMNWAHRFEQHGREFNVGWKTWIDPDYLDALQYNSRPIHPERNKYEINFPAGNFTIIKPLWKRIVETAGKVLVWAFICLIGFGAGSLIAGLIFGLVNANNW